MLPEPTQDRSIEPITGWRIWNLSLPRGREPLLHPAGAGVDAWPRRKPVRARCGTPPLLWFTRRPHQAPNPTCTCGIYASRSLDTFERPRPAYPPPPVIGTVSLWGRVIEHELGWRAQMAYPAQLRLVCSMCAWFEPGPGEPLVVHKFGGRLYTLCEIHRGGIQLPDGRRSKLTPLGPDALQARVLDAYAVEVVPLERVELLFHLPPTPEPPPYMPSIRVVPAR
ncbi:MAG TPA: hypothetical protein VE646_06445 [Actinomycetota bacterium]|jgi:hypothetical protein|nr:hypothetical protein [Actinomycetota bacterium]